ncbi:hypothetical protein G6045_10725 [Streptomyces sp. YC504]|uniref:Membrane protein YndG n=1 Tax=Streptomyces mesophilus TaxID=1775132 RepID=A0A6G4XH32_9ACTN|nr:hypothetical protein [Streptomyces mesophilus]NGO76137.1 hypothetical protein [Streptomyces mesophilus]
MAATKGLYVEARIRADLDELWERTQDPAEHRRWDLRFTSIDYLPKEAGEPQRFRYATRVLPFLTVAGTGVSAGEKHRPDGTRTSALRFSSPHPLSLLKEGSGYWRYVPDADGVRFLTGYDYTPRWGLFGEVADRLVFRPLMGWATAWSFDRLRLWLEEGVTPRRSLVHCLTEMLLRVFLIAGMLGAFGGLPFAAILWALPWLGYGVALVPVVAVPLLLFLPPLPHTPAARRCRRAPSVRTAPALLAALPTPKDL